MMETTLTGTKGGKATVSTAMTADELLRLPDDGHRYELIEGELRVMTPASPRHGRIANTLAFLLTQHARRHELGVVYAAETGFQLRQNPDTVRAADAAFVAQDRIPPEGEPEGYWTIAPDLVAEVVSASDSASAVHAKVADWLGAGCRLVWVVYPNNQTVTEYRSLTEIRVLTADQSLEGGDVLPGFDCQVGELFK
jgi:Uma2 family endonuclease